MDFYGEIDFDLNLDVNFMYGPYAVDFVNFNI